VGRVRVLIVSCLWFAASLPPAWAAGLGESKQGEDYVQGAFSLPYPLSSSEETNSFLSMNLKSFRLAPPQASSLSVLDGTVPAVQGVEARYENGLGDYKFEFTGGYVPGMNSLFRPESPRDQSAYLGYVGVTMPLSDFYFKGGAFFGQNVEALGLICKLPLEEPKAGKRDFVGYQIGGGYRFNESLSIQAGLWQAAQEYETTRDGLRAWYLQAQISLGSRMSVTPQVGFFDNLPSDGEKMKEEAFYYGARWQINF
jgi:hypothetical protein